MVPNLPEWKRIHRVFQRGLTLVEYAGLVVIGFATTYAMVEEVAAMIHAAKVTLADLLLMFLYLEVLAMIGQYFNSGQLPVRFPVVHRDGRDGPLHHPRHQGPDRGAHARGVGGHPAADPRGAGDPLRAHAVPLPRREEKIGRSDRPPPEH